MKKANKIVLILTLLLLVCTGCAKGAIHFGQSPIGVIGENMPVTRAQAAKALALLSYTQEEIQNMTLPDTFSDVTPEDWYCHYAAAASELGYFHGTGEGFFGEESLTLSQCKSILSQLSAEEENMVITEETENQPIAYSLWTELFQKAAAEQGDQFLEDAGVQTCEILVLSVEDDTVHAQEGIFGAAGYDFTPYLGERITVMEKEGEIFLLLEVIDDYPTTAILPMEAKGGEVVLHLAQEDISLPYAGDAFSQSMGTISFSAEDQVTAAVAQETMTQAVKRVTAEELWLEEEVLSWAENAKVYRHWQENWTEEEKVSLSCGYTAQIFMQDGQVVGVVSETPPSGEWIRVLLWGDDGPYHKKTLTFTTEGTLQISGDADSTDAVSTWTATPDGLEKRVVLSSDSPITIEELGKTYDGTMEVTVEEDGILLVNELPVETYLLGVVPYELPSDFPLEAQKAQAVCARNYAYESIFANTYGEYGAHVTDTTASQVYGGNERAEQARQAVEETAGQVLTSGNATTQCYYYSTSAGWGAASGDVWMQDGVFPADSKPYLVSVNHGITVAQPTSEEEWLSYFQTAQTEGYDQNSPYRRWKVYYPKGALENSLPQALLDIWEKKPSAVLVSQEDGSFAMEKPEDIGTLVDIQVIDRAESGLLRVLDFVFSGKTVRVRTENAIRTALALPADAVLVTADDVVQNGSGGLLPSGFFVPVVLRDTDGSFSGLSLYGSGFGHGVGMSQYGAAYLAESGQNYTEILSHYFPETQLQTIYGAS